MQLRPNERTVRTMVRRIFLELGITNLSELSETKLFEDGHCYARSYRVGRFMAMWLIGVGILQFYDDEGNMLRTANLFCEIEPLRRAA